MWYLLSLLTAFGSSYYLLLNFAFEYFFHENKSVGEYSGCIAAKFNDLFHLICLYDLL